MKTGFWPRVTCGASFIALGLCLPGTAQAQEAEPSAEEEVLDVIVVTALKRETAVEDTPLAISVLGEEQLKEAGVSTIQDLQNVAPSVQIGQGDFGATVNIRGVTTTDNTSKGDQGIAFNVDGITIGRPREMGTAFFDVQRIEVLRGPQGTLYGKSTTGGVINVITNRPSDEFGGSVGAEYGNFDTKRFTGVLNIPLSDSFAIRGAVSYNNRDGYLPTNDGSPAFSDQDDISGRLSALYDINNTTSLFVSSSFGHIGGVGPGIVPFSNFVPAGFAVSANDTITVSSASGKSGRTVFGVPASIAPEIDDKFINLTAEFTTEFNGVEFTYLGGHRNYDADTLSATSTAPDPGWDWGQYTGTAITDQHEIRFSNAAPSRFNWIAGYNWYREDLNESDHRWNAPAANPTRVASSPGIDPLNSTTHESSGFFGQVDYELTDKLNLTVGARYSEDEVVRVGTFAVGPNQVDATGAPCVYPNDCVGGPNNGTQSAEKLTWRLGADYKPTDSTLFYASIATGYKAGGFNDFDPATGGPGPYDPEDLTAYEAGFKGNLSPNLIWNSSAFFYDYSAAQISSLTNVQGNVVILTKLAEVEVKGWENEIIWTPTDNDVVQVGFTLNDGKYNDFTAGGHAAGTFPPIGAVFTDWSGRSIDKVSDATARVEYSHDWNLASGAKLNARVATRYDSGYVVSNITEAFQIEQDAFTRSDANLTYTSEGGGYNVGIYLRNIEDEVQVTSAPEGFPPGAASAVGLGVTEPRVFGIRFGADF